MLLSTAMIRPKIMFVIIVFKQKHRTFHHSRSVFVGVRKIAKSNYQIRHVCLSIGRHAWNSGTTGRVFLNFDI
jgi:hypothetical protein